MNHIRVCETFSLLLTSSKMLRQRATHYSAAVSALVLASELLLLGERWGVGVGVAGGTRSCPCSARGLRTNHQPWRLGICSHRRPSHLYRRPCSLVVCEEVREDAEVLGRPDRRESRLTGADRRHGRALHRHTCFACASALLIVWQCTEARKSLAWSCATVPRRHARTDTVETEVCRNRVPRC